VKYEASGWIEHFLTFEDKEDRTIFSLLRLRLPTRNEKILEVLPVLEWCAIIREIHTFWDQLSPGEKWGEYGQHVGFGKRLIAESEQIARNAGFKKMAVIAWPWVRQYYEKRWYHLEGEYMTKGI
jgi:elongator complex protein 3